MADEDNEETEQVQPSQPSRNVDDIEKIKQLEKLNEYVQQMAYKPFEPPQASQRTESLAKPKKKYIVGTYTEHKDNLQPKERSERVRRTVEKYKPFMAEQLEDFIRKHRQKEAQRERDKQRQQINYHKTLLKLQKQCEQQLMNAIVRKFAKEVTKRTSLLPSSNVETESYQCLQNAITCNMLLSLELPNNNRHLQDYTLYKKIAAVLADMILQALFLAYNENDQDGAGDRNLLQINKQTGLDNVLKIRALPAAKKKLKHQKKKDYGHGRTVLSHYLNK